MNIIKTSVVLSFLFGVVSASNSYYLDYEMELLGRHLNQFLSDPEQALGYLYNHIFRAILLVDDELKDGNISSREEGADIIIDGVTDAFSKTMHVSAIQDYATEVCETETFLVHDDWQHLVYPSWLRTRGKIYKRIPEMCEDLNLDSVVPEPDED